MPAAADEDRHVHGSLLDLQTRLRRERRVTAVELLRRMFTPDSINTLWRHAISGKEPPSARACPSCRRAMLEVALSDTDTVRVDVCRLCHFVWFDAHETESLVARPLPPREPKKPSFRVPTHLKAVEDSSLIMRFPGALDRSSFWTSPDPRRTWVQSILFFDGSTYDPEAQKGLSSGHFCLLFRPTDAEASWKLHASGPHPGPTQLARSRGLLI